jgi:hypothetical protein
MKLWGIVIACVLGFSVAASAAVEGNYHLSCSSDVDDARVFSEPDVTKPYAESGEVVVFPKHTDFSVDQIIEKNGQQFLSGRVLEYVRGRPHSIIRKTGSTEDRDRFYGLPEHWDCKLYRGDEEARCSADAAVVAYAKLYQECRPKKGKQ